MQVAKETFCFAVAGLILTGVIALQNVNAKENLLAKNVETQPVKANFSSFMVLGDSIPFGYMAGYKRPDGTEIPQVDQALVIHSWPKLVADQAGTELLLPFYAPKPDNLAVPGYTLADMKNNYSVLLAKNSVTQLVMGQYFVTYGDTTPVNYVLKENPTILAVMIGNNDILGAAIYANIALKTPAVSFEAMYEEMVDKLAADANRTVVVSTIPDVANIPFLVPVRKIFPETITYPAFNEDKTEYKLQSSDFITLTGAKKIQSSTALTKCPNTSSPSYQCVGDILTQDEINEISNHTKVFNAAIRRIASQHDNVAVMNFDTLFENLQHGNMAVVPSKKHFFLVNQGNGIIVEGKHYTLAYDGGLISKDGIHPTKLGHGVIANEMIKTLNENFAAGIQPIDLGPIAAEDALANKVFSPSPVSFDSGAFEKSRSIFKRKQSTN